MPSLFQSTRTHSLIPFTPRYHIRCMAYPLYYRHFVYRLFPRSLALPVL